MSPIPISYKIDGGVVYTTVTGKVEVQEQIDFMQDLFSNPALPSPLLILRDTRNQIGYIKGSHQELTSFATSLPISAKVAIVASKDVVFGTSRMFQVRVNETHNVSVFRDIDEAREWLGSEHHGD